MLARRLAPRAARGLRALCGAAPDVSAADLDLFERFAEEQATPVTLQMMRGLATTPESRLASVGFLRRELLVRTAHALSLINGLGFGLPRSAPIQRIQANYWHQLRTLDAAADEDDSGGGFTAALRALKERDSYVVPMLADGVTDLRRMELSLADETALSQEISALLLQRLSIRMLIGQYVESAQHRGGRVRPVMPVDVVRAAVDAAGVMCERALGVPAPDVAVLGGDDAPFVYVPSHLQHIVFELVKNSMHAVVDAGATEHPIRVIISQGAEDVTIKVSDRGGGIKRSDWPRLWLYTYTTHAGHAPVGGESFREQFSGGGYGLPYARLFARYFGGDLEIVPLEGWGTDAYVQLSRLANKHEVLPAAHKEVGSLVL